MDGFRLLEVGSVVATDHLNDVDLDNERSIQISVPESWPPRRATWVSVLIGRNGQGKSRTLGGIASLFAGARVGKLQTRDQRSFRWRVRYSVGEDECELWSTERGAIRARMQGQDWPVDLVPMPSKVIALSTTAMDKFPLPSSAHSKDDGRSEELYSYMGLRDRTGRASATAVVFRALEALVEATEDTTDRRARIAEVFDFLGYAPRVEHTYRWRYSSLFREPDSIRKLLNSELASIARRTVATRLRRMVDRDPGVVDELQTIVDQAGAMTRRGELRLIADFRDASSSELEQFYEVQLLKRAGLVELSTVELRRSDTGVSIDLREVSSGELSIATTFLGLAAVIEDNSLIIIDEPEVSLHPEWQSQYLGLLTEVFAKYEGCHFLVATHSPLVVSDISDVAANIVSLDPHRQTVESGAAYAGDSVDEVLVRAFDVVGKNNLFVKQRLVEALRLAADGKILSTQFSEAIAPLARLAPSLEPDSATRDLIVQLLDARERSLQ